MILLDFEGFWLDFWKNGRNQQNLGNFGGPTPQRRHLTQQRRTTPRRGISTHGVVERQV